MYEGVDEEGRIGQRQETEMKLREMIHYTNGSLNATVRVTMMDENGYAFCCKIINSMVNYYIA